VLGRARQRGPLAGWPARDSGPVRANPHGTESRAGAEPWTPARTLGSGQALGWFA